MSTNIDTTEVLDEVLDGFGMYARWYGFDEAMDTKGKHTSSTPTEAKEQARQAILDWVNEVVIGKDRPLVVDKYNRDRLTEVKAVNAGINGKLEEQRNNLRWHGWKESK